MCSVGASGTNIGHAYIDQEHNVHIVEQGVDRRITTDRRSRELEVSPDRAAVLWLHEESGTAEVAPGAASELFVYIGGNLRKIRCDTFVRDFWFWMRGKRIGIACGALHFSCRETLYDAETLEAIDSFDQRELGPDARPAWSKTSEIFAEDGD